MPRINPEGRPPIIHQYTHIVPLSVYTCAYLLQALLRPYIKSNILTLDQLKIEFPGLSAGHSVKMRPVRYQYKMSFQQSNFL